MLRRVLTIGALVLVVGFLLIQLVPYGRDHTNPAVLAEPAWDSATTRSLAVTACFDCHSNQTEWPWYSNVAPLSWLVQRHVDKGRRQLNFSEWGSTREQEADQSAQTVRNGSMPPFSYVLLHPGAALSDADRSKLIAGLAATFGDGGGRGETGGDGD